MRDLDNGRPFLVQAGEEFHDFSTLIGVQITGRFLGQDQFWIGDDALDLGLIDKIGHLEPTMKELFGPDIVFRSDTDSNNSLWDMIGDLTVSHDPNVVLNLVKTVVEDISTRLPQARV